MLSRRVGEMHKILMLPVLASARLEASPGVLRRRWSAEAKARILTERHGRRASRGLKWRLGWLRQCGKSSSATRRSVPAATFRRPF
jgi:hypothetical protein